MANLCFIDDPDDLYIHKTISGIENISINNSSDTYNLNNIDFDYIEQIFTYSIMSIDIGITH